MKKKSAVFFLLFGASLFASLDRPTREIECAIRPIERSKIHPKDASNSTSPTTQSVSSNWSGYVAGTSLDGSSSANGTASYVAGAWVVPALLPTTDGTYCAIWVGLDGYNCGTVEQIGTSHNWLSGAQQNYAWFEMYPNGAYEIGGFPVNNGDLISARVGYKGNNTYKLIIINHTQNVSTTIPTSYTMSTTAQRCCAEWVIEAPYSGGILPLADFKTVTLNYCSAIINGVSGVINNGTWMNSEITMEKSGGVEAQPTALLKNGSCFQVSWKSE